MEHTGLTSKARRASKEFPGQNLSTVDCMSMHRLTQTAAGMSSWICELVEDTLLGARSVVENWNRQTVWFGLRMCSVTLVESLGFLKICMTK